MTHCRDGIAFVHPTALVALVGLFSLTATGAGAEDMMGMNKAKESGVYVGLNYARSEVDTAAGSVDGDGETLLIGYRFNDTVRVEYSRESVDYDDITNYFNIDRISTEGDFQFLSLIYQAHFDNWQPYVRLALGDSEVDEVQYLNDGTVQNFSASDSGIAVGFGVDYAVTDSFSLRADFVSYSEDQDVLNIGPIYHF
jgi:opacity protein-like surface antigen